LNKNDVRVSMRSQTSFFGGTPPLSEATGYGLCIFAGALFSVVTWFLVHLDYKYAVRNPLPRKGRVTLILHESSGN
jgi:hypothetical protein